MKVSIDSQRGVVSELAGSGVTIEGREYHEAAFDERWDDLYAYIDQGTGPAALTYESYRDTGFFMRFFRHNQDDLIFMSYQMSHQWDPSTSIRPHMHCIPMASGSGNVKFNYVYSWCLVNSEMPAASGWITGSVTASFTPADQYKQRVVSFGTIAPTSGSQESVVFVLKVERPGASDAADTYITDKVGGTGAANLGVLFFDLHYQKIKAGTAAEYPAG